MSKYILRKQGTGQYVQNPGSNKSYTRNMRQPETTQDAQFNNIRIFDSLLQAQNDACGNEYPVELMIAYR